VLYEVPEPPIRLLGVAVASELPDGPETSSIHVWIHAASVGKLAGIAELLIVGALDIIWRVQWFYGDAGHRRELGVALGALRVGFLPAVAGCLPGVQGVILLESLTPTPKL
jgi:hypothetical protein